MGKNSNETTFSMHWMMHNNVLLMIVNIIIIIHAVFLLLLAFLSSHGENIVEIT